MANYANLLATIAANIYTNNNNEVTAAMVKAAVDQMVASLGDGYQFAATATPSTDPGTPDQKVFYIASEPGTYTNFGGIVVRAGELAILKGSGSSWSKETFAGQYVYTDSPRANGAIRKIFFDKAAYTGALSLNGLYFDSFGYYSLGGIFYANLKNENNQVLFNISIPYADVSDNFIIAYNVSGALFYMEVNWMDFYNNSPKQITFNLLDTCFIDTRVRSEMIKAGAVTEPKLATDAVSSAKILKGAVENLKLRSRIPIFGTTSILSSFTKTEDYFINENGVVQGPFSGMWNYYRKAVRPDDRFKATAYAGQSARLWVITNPNGVVLACSSYDGAVSLRTESFVCPAGSAFLYINGRTDSVPAVYDEVDAKIDANEVFVDASKSIVQYVDERGGSRMHGKTLVCCGDSITYGADMPADGIIAVPTIEMYQRSGVFSPVTANAIMSYGYQIAARNGMVFYNDGVSGSTMQGEGGVSGFSLASGRYTTLPDNIDYLTIWFGWNDAAYGTLGTIDDATNDTFYGGYNVVMPYLINKYPYAKIALIVPFGTTAAHREAVRLLANKWGVACFDMYQGGTPLYYGKEPSVGVDASIVADNQAKFQALGAHPNFQGHTQLADMIENFLRSI